MHREDNIERERGKAGFGVNKPELLAMNLSRIFFSAHCAAQRTP